jgi:hypothetical protein
MGQLDLVRATCNFNSWSKGEEKRVGEEEREHERQLALWQLTLLVTNPLT